LSINLIKQINSVTGSPENYATKFNDFILSSQLINFQHTHTQQEQICDKVVIKTPRSNTAMNISRDNKATI